MTPAQLAAIGLKAVELHAAMLHVKETKIAYLTAWDDFEAADPLGERVTVHHPRFEEMRLATKTEYEAYQKAKVDMKNAAGRLERACRRAR